MRPCSRTTGGGSLQAPLARLCEELAPDTGMECCTIGGGSIAAAPIGREVAGRFDPVVVGAGPGLVGVLGVGVVGVEAAMDSDETSGGT